MEKGLEYFIRIPDWPKWSASYEGNIIGPRNKPLSRNKKKGGYPYVSFWKDGKRHQIFTHVIIATMFVLNPDNKPTVNHKDRDKTNPHADNLEWSTRSEQVIHSYQTGRGNTSKLTKEEALEIISLSGYLTKKQLAVKYGVSVTTISRKIRGWGIYFKPK